jgi:hypothetical protein
VQSLGLYSTVECTHWLLLSVLNGEDRWHWLGKIVQTLLLQVEVDAEHCFYGFPAATTSPVGQTAEFEDN